MNYKVIGQSDNGVYLELSNGKVEYLFWNEIEEHKLVSIIKEGFEENWPSTWNSIKETLPPGPTVPLTPYPQIGLIQGPADLYFLTLLDLLLSGIFSRTTGEKLLVEIGKSKKNPLGKVINALGIRDIGEGTSKLLAKHFDSLDELGKASPGELLSITGLGEARVISLFTWFHTEGNWKELEKLRLGGLDYAFGYRKPQGKRESPIKGKIFMFTGKLSLFTRDQAQSLVEEKGGIAGTSVSKNTDFLVVGEGPGSKLAHASLLNVPTLTEKEFLELTR